LQQRLVAAVGRRINLNMVIAGQNVTLRDLVSQDLDDYRRWFFTEAEWQKWDAPWETSISASQSYIDRIAKRLHTEPPAIRGRLEICVDNAHIGWVSSYLIDNKADFLAVGINIAERGYWGTGIGRVALSLWIKYLFQTRKPTYIYCETWGGNERMIKLALNLGFEIIEKYTRIETDGKEYKKFKFRISDIFSIIEG